MSYEISYRRQAFRIPAAQTGQASYYGDLLFLIEECGSNNCWEIGSRRRARDWQCTAVGAEWECLADITRCAATCCGGSLVLYGRRRGKPEAYIRAWRRVIAAAVPIAEAPRMGFHIELLTRIPDAAAKDGRKYAFEQLSGQTLVQPRRATDDFNGAEYTEWRFNPGVPEQVKLWLGTKASSRAFRSVDADGPGR
jgi:hypothetical protein